MLALLALLALPGAAGAGVVISEIHYHPPAPGEGTFEYIELHNPSADPVDLEGHAFVRGIEYEFPTGAVLPAGGYVVVARRRAEFIEHFGPFDGFVEDGVFGDYGGSLDNSGEEVALADADRAIIDVVRYDDLAPWPRLADGGGASLERLCASYPGHRVENWASSLGDAPTPFAGRVGSLCPPEPSAAPRVIISEIHYHPLNDLDDRDEYVEIHNPTVASIDLGGWSFSDGIGYRFPDGVILPAGGYLAVARDAAALRERFPLGAIVGNFSGSLSNRGERLALVDPGGVLSDSVRYRDQGDWPYAADGFGRSLEKVWLAAPGDDAASWDRSRLVSTEYDRVETTGRLDAILTQRLVLAIHGRGEFLIDNVSLRRVDRVGENLIEGGDFEGEFPSGTWQASGVASSSRVEDGVGTEGSRALRLLSTGECPTEPCGSADGVSIFFASSGLDLDAEYRLSFDYRFISGSTALQARMLRGPEVSFQSETLSPGLPNPGAALSPAPNLSHVSRYPEEPTSRDRVWITARVRPPPGGRLATVVIAYRRGDLELDVETTVPMHDDGAHRDADPGDGVFGVDLPPLPHNAQVHFRLIATTEEGGLSVYPSPLDPGLLRTEEYHGYYVNDERPETPLPVYHVLVPGVDPTNPEAINRALSCYSLRPGSFAYRGDLYPLVHLRFRGNTACVIQKRNLKVRFHGSRDFGDVHKINLQGLWTDKALVREKLAWDLVEELGLPSCETEYIRVHVNGAYHGLFLYLEHPDHRFLRRSGLDPDGYLYKARQPPRTDGSTPIGVARQETLEDYERYWERETREAEDLSPIASFIGDLHDDLGQITGPSRAFVEERLFAEDLIGYQVGQVVLNNIDSFAKNHFLYRPANEDRWSFFTWDLDLVFGKFFDPDVVAFPERPVGTLNDCMLSDVGGDLNPWFTARVEGNPLYNYLVDAFLRADSRPDGSAWYQRAYLVRLWDVLHEKYVPATYDERLDDLVDLLWDEHALDLERWGRYTSNPECVTADEVVPNIETIKDQIRRHRSFLLSYIRTHHPEIPDHARVKITEIMYDSEGPREDLEFIELLNTSGRPVELTGWSLTGGVSYTFPSGSEVAADETFIVARDPGAFEARYGEAAAGLQVWGPWSGRLANEGEIVSIVDAGPNHPATIDRVEYSNEWPWPDRRDGRSLELIDLDPDVDNDRPEWWRLSAASGGSPGSDGRVAQFVRGDVDGRGSANIADAVAILEYLFRGGAVPACLDAADVDDNGRIMINDPIYLLGFLFLGGAPVPPPFPDAGVDPTDDALPCAAGV